MSYNERKSPGFWSGLIRQLGLAWHLLWDPNVPLWTKLVPFIGLVYILSPIDLIPDPILGLGQLDDLGVLLLGLRMFIQLVPDEVIERHLRRVSSKAGEWRVVDEELPAIDAEYEVKDEVNPR